MNQEMLENVYYERHSFHVVAVTQQDIITVTLDDENVGASPVEVEVEEGADEEESIAVDYMFTIEARTKGGVPRNRGGENFAVAITDSEVPFYQLLREEKIVTLEYREIKFQMSLWRI